MVEIVRETETGSRNNSTMSLRNGSIKDLGEKNKKSDKGKKKKKVGVRVIVDSIHLQARLPKECPSLSLILLPSSFR